MHKFSKEEFDIIGHTLGVKPGSKEQPAEYYRNYFCASVEHDDYKILCDLQNRGVMERWEKFGNIYFGVTEQGISQYREQLKYPNGKITTQVVKSYDYPQTS